MSVKLLYIDVCKLRDDFSYNEGIVSVCKVMEILLLFLREMYFILKYKIVVFCVFFLKSLSLLFLLINIVFKKMVNGCDFK